jgi:hypothetical protein
MPVRRILFAAAVLILLPQASAGAAVLIEARKHGEPFRMVIDNDRQRALITTARGESLVDLRQGELYLRGPSGVARKMRIAAPAALAGTAYRVEPWGPGPVMSGHATVYHVISHGEEICAEMLVSGWMKPFVVPVVQALDLLEDLSGTPRGGGCERIPFAIYAAEGWPMIAGKLDHLTFETRSIDFEYEPDARELAIPAHYQDGRPDRTILEAFAPKP